MAREPRPGESLIDRTGTTLRGYWAGAASYQLMLYWVALIFAASAVVHTGVFLVDGGAWEGPVSWRKPITFGVSFALVSVSLAWVMTFLPRRPVKGWLLLGSFAAASLGEVGLITMQRWRGVASHFNTSTDFDAAVFSTMGALIAVVVIDIVVITIWSFRSLDAPPGFPLAIRAGLVLLVVGQGAGGLIIREGNRLEELGPVSSPVISGEAGIMNVPHFIALHALQVLPLLAIVLSLSARPESSRRLIVAIASGGYTALVAVSLLQALGGRAPFDLTLVVGFLFYAGVLALAGAFAVALASLLSRRSGSLRPLEGS